MQFPHIVNPNAHTTMNYIMNKRHNVNGFNNNIYNCCNAYAVYP